MITDDGVRRDPGRIVSRRLSERASSRRAGHTLAQSQPEMRRFLSWHLVLPSAGQMAHWYYGFPEMSPNLALPKFHHTFSWWTILSVSFHDDMMTMSVSEIFFEPPSSEQLGLWKKKGEDCAKGRNMSSTISKSFFGSLFHWTSDHHKEPNVRSIPLCLNFPMLKEKILDKHDLYCSWFQWFPLQWMPNFGSTLWRTNPSKEKEISYQFGNDFCILAYLNSAS